MSLIPSGRPSRTTRLFPHFAFAVCLLTSLAITGAGISRQSPTVDEPTHLVRGLSLWWTGDTRMSYAHPPLANAIAALPGALRDRGERPAFEKMNGWKQASPGHLTIAYANRNYEQLRSEWVLGRWAMLAMSAAFLVYLHVWVTRRFGALVAACGVGLLATTPSFLAHASLVTTDGPMVAMFTITVCELIGFIEQRTRARALRFGLVLGAALLTKFSAAVLVPLALLVLVADAVVGRGARWRGASARRRVMALVADFAVISVVACFTVNAGYGFQRIGWTVERILAAPEPQNNISNDYDDDLLEKKTPLAKMPGALVVPLPYSYVFGISTIKVQTSGGHPLRSYFLGEIRNEGVPYYFPLLLLLKVPLVAWLALVPGVWLAVRQRAYALLVPAALALCFLGLIMRSGLHIGVRHALPVLPPLMLLAGLAIARVLDATRRFRPLALAAAGVAGLIMVDRASADFLGDFNALAGDSEGQRRVSVIGEDWGQDVAALGLLVKAEGLTPLHFVGIGHTGNRELARLGIQTKGYKCRRPEGAQWIAIHDSKLVRQPGCFKWLPAEPRWTVNNHIRVYELPPAPDDARTARRGIATN